MPLQEYLWLLLFSLLLYYLLFPQLWQIVSQVIMLPVHWVSAQSVCNQLQAHSWQEKSMAFIWIVLALILTTSSKVMGKKGWFCCVLHGDSLLRSIHTDELAAMCRVWLVSPPASPLFMNHQMLCQQLRNGCTEPQSWCFVKYNLSFVAIEVQIWWLCRIYCSQRLTVERVTFLGKKIYSKIMYLGGDKMVREQSRIV